MSGIAAQLIATFASGAGAGAFPHVGGSRALFAKGIRDRVANPGLIDQGLSSLCGPASFLYCLASKRPDVYARYAIELYEQGQTTVGKLRVAPSSDCRRAAINPREIDPVDWVTLASLRDSQNTVMDYQSVSDAVAGITLPQHLANWFSSSEQFSQVVNNTNVVFDKNLSSLLAAEQFRIGGSYICLFVDASILHGKCGVSFFPNHWIVLTNHVRINGQTTTGLASRGLAVDADEALASGPLSFEVFTWGQPHRAFNPGNSTVAVSTFLNCFYGYVCAK